ncbi:hypothetical protein EHS13_32480 [Paenibacillus psychroresistens]|uniref:Copper amine oxidase-like N-terminal domain-containing protein n=1 Tax=Paenibacillus psychroresistens TaxID=1778678 RepID=A0A6B8RXS5_9BACL|nr:hypothetical protein EHS13_32480 [Paenibacillus psychroresistens]
MEKTLVPVRFICKSVGANVSWDKSTKSVILTNK